MLLFTFDRLLQIHSASPGFVSTDELGGWWSPVVGSNFASLIGTRIAGFLLDRADGSRLE